jgi:hypothetical protein
MITKYGRLQLMISLKIERTELITVTTRNSLTDLSCSREATEYEA